MRNVKNRPLPEFNATEPVAWIGQCLSKITPRIGTGRKCAVDIAAGNLRHSRVLVHQFGFPKVIAIDIEPFVKGPLEPEIEIRRMDARKFTMPPKSADVVIWWNASYLFAPSQIRILLEQIRKGLADGGVFFGNFLYFPQDPSEPRFELTTFSEEKIKRALYGLKIAVIEQPQPEGSGLQRLPGAKMLLVMACNA